MPVSRNGVGVRLLPDKPLIAVKPYHSSFGDDVAPPPTATTPKAEPRPVRKLDLVDTLQAQLKSERRTRDQVQLLMTKRIEALEFQNKELLTAFIAQSARNLTVSK
jgi:hypothetical protein